MKKPFAILIAMLLLVFSTVCYAKRAPEEVPEEIEEYAENRALPYYKWTIKQWGFVPPCFESIEDIDALTLGKSYKLYAFKYLDEENISDTMWQLEMWLYTLDLETPKMFLYIIGHDPLSQNENDPITDTGPFYMDDLMAALEVFDRVAKNAGVEAEPILLHESVYDLALYMNINGDERVIPVTSAGCEFDKDYLAVEYYTQLPTGKDLIDAYTLRAEEAAADEAAGNGAGGVRAIKLSPKLDAAAPYGRPVSPAMRILPYAACVIGAAAFIVIAIALKKEKARAND